MKNHYHILIPIILCISFLTCSRDKNILSVDPINELTGTWSETFDWEGFYPIFVTPDKNTILPKIQRTSTLTLFEDRFCVKILPPIRMFKAIDDSLFVGFAEDTLYTGQYQVIDDTIIFHLDDGEESSMYHYAIKNDTLKLDAFFKADTADTSGQIFGGSFINFLWAYSFLKKSGNFIRVE